MSKQRISNIELGSNLHNKLKSKVQRKFITNNFPKFRDTHKIRDFLDTRLLEIDGVVLAGGAVQSIITDTLEVKDYDVFFLNSKSCAMSYISLINQGFTVNNRLESTDKEASILNMTKGTLKIQLINIKTYDTVEDLLKSFDFTCTQVALSKGGFHFLEGSIVDVLEKHIAINFITYPGSSYKRLGRYISKGFTVNSLLKQQLMYDSKLDIHSSFFYDYVIT